MKRLLALLAGLLIAGPASAISLKGIVANCSTVDLASGACAGLGTGTRAYDTTLGYEVTYTGAAWVASGGTGTVGSLDISDDPPTLEFEDTGEPAAADATLEGQILVNCITDADCDMNFSVNSGGEALTEQLSILTETGGTSTVYLGRNVAAGTAWADTQTWVGVSEGAGLAINNGSPGVFFHDSDMADTEDSNAHIQVNCPTGTTAGGDEDCDMDLMVQSDGTAEPAIIIDGVASDDFDVHIGQGTATAANYVTITENGLLYMHSTAPWMYFDKTNEAGGGDATSEAQIGIGCGTEDDCFMDLVVEAGGTQETLIYLDGVDANDFDVHVGDHDGGNYINVDQAGVLTGVGTGGVAAAGILDSVCSQVESFNFNPDETQVTYIDITDSSQAAAEGTEDNFVIPHTTTLNLAELYCYVDVAPGVGNDDWKMTLRNGAMGGLADSVVTCAIDEAAVTCNDGTNVEAMTDFEAVTLKVDPTGPGANPAAAATMWCSFCFTN